MQNSISAQYVARSIPSRDLPVPTTVSLELQALIAAPLRTGWNAIPTTPAGWKALAEAGLAAAKPNVAAMAARLQVTITPGKIDGVRIFTVTPPSISPANRDRLLVQIHGGCYVLNPAEAGLPEAMLIAAIGGFKVIAVDYRMPPEAYFPAALDDAMTVWKSVSAGGFAKRVGLIGTSLAMVAAFIGPVVRSHWAIENSLHWVMDMTFRNDECRVRTDHAPANFTTIKHMAHNLLRTAASKDSLRLRRKIAAWDDDFLASMIAA